MATRVDTVTSGKMAVNLYNRYYRPTSNLALHAGAASLLRHVRGDGSIARRRRGCGAGGHPPGSLTRALASSLLSWLACPASTPSSTQTGTAGASSRPWLPSAWAGSAVASGPGRSGRSSTGHASSGSTSGPVRTPATLRSAPRGYARSWRACWRFPDAEPTHGRPGSLPRLPGREERLRGHSSSICAHCPGEREDAAGGPSSEREIVVGYPWTAQTQTQLVLGRRVARRDGPGIPSYDQGQGRRGQRSST